MKCPTSCAAYDAWLEPETDWEKPNPCDGCLQVGVANCIACINKDESNG